MSDFADFFPKLAEAALLLVVALAAAPLFKRIRLPSPAAFLAVGIAAGLLGVAPTADLSAVRLEQVGAVCLFLILFQGGLGTGLGRARLAAGPILMLGIVGTAATATGLALIGRFVLGLDWSLALLVAVALAPTDPAAVYSVLRVGRGSMLARSVLEGESGFNDPAAISLMATVTAAIATSASGYGDSAVSFVEELAIGTAAGVAGGIVLVGALRATPHLDADVRTLALLGGAILLGALTAWGHGSGFLAVYIAGLVLSDDWADLDRTSQAIPEALSSTAEVLLFATLGAAFAPVVGPADLLRGLVLTLATVCVVRPVVAAACLVKSRLTGRERALVSWGGLKGAVPLLLAAYPALEHFGGTATIEAIVLVATAASLVVQGATLSIIAERTEPQNGP